MSYPYSVFRKFAKKTYQIALLFKNSYLAASNTSSDDSQSESLGSLYIYNIKKAMSAMLNEKLKTRAGEEDTIFALVDMTFRRKSDDAEIYISYCRELATNCAQYLINKRYKDSTKMLEVGIGQPTNKLGRIVDYKHLGGDKYEIYVAPINFSNPNRAVNVWMMVPNLMSNLIQWTGLLLPLSHLPRDFEEIIGTYIGLDGRLPERFKAINRKIYYSKIGKTVRDIQFKCIYCGNVHMRRNMWCLPITTLLKNPKFCFDDFVNVHEEFSSAMRT